MDVHKNARLTPAGREIMVRRVVEGGQTPKALSAAVGVCPRTVQKWVERFRAEGVAGLQDRSSRPHRLRRATPRETVARIESLRRQRWTGVQIARDTGVSKATVSRVLRRLGLNRLRALEPAEPIRRYQREHPGELIHIDIKKLGRFDRVGHRITGDRTGQSNSRGVGWEYVHVCIDDASRIAFAQVMPDEKKESASPS
jgi:transposase